MIVWRLEKSPDMSPGRAETATVVRRPRAREVKDTILFTGEAELVVVESGLIVSTWLAVCIYTHQGMTSGSPSIARQRHSRSTDFAVG